MPKKQLTEKQIKKLIKKLKDAKKKKKKTKKDALISQKVTQKVIIGSNIKDKNESNAGRSFPQIQFLPQQNMDTQLLRDLLLKTNSSPLTREVTSRVENRPNYDLADQYGLNNNYNPFYSGYIQSMGQQQDDNQTDISSLSEDAPELNSEYSSFFGNDSNSNNDLNTNSVLQPPAEKQGTLDTPIPPPKPNTLAQSKITAFYQPEENDLFSRETEIMPDDTRTLVRPMDWFNTEKLPADDEFVRLNEIPKQKKKEKKKKYLPEDVTILSAETEIVTPIVKEKNLGRPPGSKNKPKKASNVISENK